MPSVVDSVPESHRDLLERPLAAIFTTVDDECRPQSTAVWFPVDADGLLKCSTTADRQKFKNLRRNPNCVLFVIDPDNSFRTLEVRAEAELAPDPEEATVRKLARVYGVAEELLVNAGGERYNVVLHARRVVALPR